MSGYIVDFFGIEFETFKMEVHFSREKLKKTIANGQQLLEKKTNLI